MTTVGGASGQFYQGKFETLPGEARAVDSASDVAGHGSN